MEDKAKTALALVATATVLAAAAPVAAYVAPQLAGADEALIVLTGSMRPAINPGDVVLVSQTPIDDVRVGDVVTFHPHVGTEKTFTHRVVEITRDGRGTILTTKGDANEDPDPMQVNDAMLVGTVEHEIPFLGRAIAAIQGPAIPLALVVLSILTIGHEVRSLLVEPEDEHDGPAQRFPVVQPDKRFEVVHQR